MPIRSLSPFAFEPSDLSALPLRHGEPDAISTSPGEGIVRGTDHADYLYPHPSDRVFLFGGDDYAYFQRGF